MALFFTGDCHGDYTRFSKAMFPEQKNLTKEDYVIVCGDFGYWTPSQEQEEMLDILEQLPFTLLFLDGNHENHAVLDQMKVKLWHGGTVHQIRSSVYHLMRGQVYELDGKRIFTFGGASSHDVPGGILNRKDPEFTKKSDLLSECGIPYRIEGESWWPRELPDEEEYREGYANLEQCGWKVDLIATHCCSTTTMKKMNLPGCYRRDALTDYLDTIKEKCRFERWYFGHYHQDRRVSKKETVLYKKIVRVE